MRHQLTRTILCISAATALAACGGGGGVQPIAETPDPVVLDPMDDPIEVVETVEDDPIEVVEPDEPIEPAGPIVITPELGDVITIDLAANTAEIGAFSSLDPDRQIDRYVSDTARLWLDNTNDNGRVHFGVVAIDESYAAVGGVSVASAEFYELEGRTFQVTDISTVPTGTATYQGDYLGVLFSSNNTSSDVQVQNGLINGRATLEATFGETVTETTMSGGVTNREFLRSAGRGEYLVGNAGIGFADITFTDIVVANDGLFQGGISGGEKFYTDLVPEGFRAVFEVTGGEVVGQIGDNGDVIAGTVRFTNIATETGAFSTLDIDTHTGFEIGAFVVAPE